MAKTKNLRLRKTFWWGDDGKVFCSLAFRVFWWVGPTFLQRVRTWRARARRWWRRPGSCRWSSAPPPHQLAAADSRSQHLKTILSRDIIWCYIQKGDVDAALGGSNTEPTLMKAFGWLSAYIMREYYVISSWFLIISKQNYYIQCSARW